MFLTPRYYKKKVTKLEWLSEYYSIIIVGAVFFFCQLLYFFGPKAKYTNEIKPYAQHETQKKIWFSFSSGSGNSDNSGKITVI